MLTFRTIWKRRSAARTDGAVDARTAPQGLFRRFLARSGGNVAIIFGFSLLPVIAFAGTVVDYGLATQLKAKLQASTDAAALRLCQMDPVSATLSVLQTQAGLLMTGFMGNVTVMVDPLTVLSTPRKIQLPRMRSRRPISGA